MTATNSKASSTEISNDNIQSIFTSTMEDHKVPKTKEGKETISRFPIKLVHATSPSLSFRESTQAAANKGPQ